LDLFAKAERFDRARDLRAVGLYPYFRAVGESHGGTRVVIDGRELVMAGSNNYLGLTHDPRVIKAAQDALTEFGTGCTGSRFLNGTLKLHEEFEARLAAFLGKEAAITCGTGFQTNVGAIECLAHKADVIFGDRDNHASLIDGCRLSYAKHRKYLHNDMEDLERLLQQTEIPKGGGRLIVTDGVFSMLGDLAPLPRMVELAKQYEARLMLDDAHAVGAVGPNGRGTAEHFGVMDDVDLIVGTFSKSFACLGGFVAGTTDIIDFIKHTSRSVIFSASMTPASVATVMACLEIIESEPERRKRLWENVAYMEDGLNELGFDVIAGGGPILSVVIGEEQPTLEFNHLLFQQGVFVNPVIPPAVPPGMSLLRTSYMATHTREDLDRVLAAFRTVGEQLRVTR
jgi:8-amino-7-oxononanoate synthase